MTSTRRRIATLAVGCLLAAAAFAAYHFYLRGLMLETGLRLGAVRPSNKVYRVVPLYIYWRPRLKTGVLIALAVVTLFVWWLRRSLVASGTRQRNGTRTDGLQGPVTYRTDTESPARSRVSLYACGPVRFILALIGWHVAIAVAVALVDGGPRTLWQPYDIHRRSDYIGAVERIESPRAFLHDYPGLMPELPLHCRHHPPGSPLLLWALGQLFGNGPIVAATATILLASLASPAVYLLARDVLEEGPARLAAGLFVLAPNVVCYSATCMDSVFMVPLTWSFFCLWHGRTNRPVLCGIAGGLAASAAAMMTFSTSFVALWAVAVIGVTAVFDRGSLRNALLTLLTAAATTAIAYLLLYFWSDYDPLAVLQQAFAGQDEVMKGRGHSSLRQSAHFSVANLIAFAFCSGLPVVWLWGCQTFREARRATSSGARGLLLSFCLTLLLIDLAPLYTLETERIWIFLVGFLAIGAAARLAADECSLPASPLVLAAVVLQAGQTILMEVLLEWVW
jgi:hypothetical protein